MFIASLEDTTSSITYQLRSAVATAEDLVEISFQTTAADGSLLRIGQALDGTSGGGWVGDFLFIHLQQGNLVVVMDLGGGTTQVLLSGPFHTGTWRTVQVHRRQNSIEAWEKGSGAAPVRVEGSDRFRTLDLPRGEFVAGAVASGVPGLTGLLRRAAVNGIDIVQLAGAGNDYTAARYVPCFSSGS